MLENETKRLFNQRAHSWDRQHPHDAREIRAILHISGVEPGSAILDVGCGTGVLEPFLLELEPRKIVAVDFAQSMIEVAQGKCRSPVIEYLCADIFTLRGLQFDCAFLYNCFPHFPDPPRLFRHLASLLAPKGRLVISHTQSKAAENMYPGALPLAAESLLKGMRPLFQVDVAVDNKAMFLVSGLKK